jgi:DNA-binding CsgD family transcriptional regulator
MYISWNLKDLKKKLVQAEIRAKTAELASTTMHLLQKRDLISKVKEGLTNIKKQGGVEPVPQNYKKLIKVLNEEEHVEDEWQIFATHFDTVHLDFLRLIKKSHPNLTPHELKLCAYLHMNLCSKQIAQHMKISVRGVEIGRYRLRKKLQVPREANLFEFLLYFSSSNHHQQEIN